MQKPYFEVDYLEVVKQHFNLGPISFEIEQGDYVVILGPTGCGKTMLLESLVGLRRLHKGEIYLEGEAITKWQPEERRFGFAYQDHLLLPFLKVKENILFGSKVGKNERILLDRLNILVKRMGIEHLLDRYPKSLSGGERQRVSLARAILRKPSLLLLDEPLSALDPKTKDQIIELLKDLHHSEGLTIVHVTHDFNEALQLGNRLIIMKDGKIIQSGDTKDVFRQPKTYFVASFLQMRNCIQGYMKRMDLKSYFWDTEHTMTIGPLSHHAYEGKGYLLIREDDFKVSLEREERKENSLSFEVVLIEAKVSNHYTTLVCEGIRTWYVTVSLREWRALDVKLGTKLFLSVISECVRFLKNDEGEV